MTELESLRWAMKVGADNNLAEALLAASPGTIFPAWTAGSIKPDVDISWVPAATAIDPDTIDGVTLWSAILEGFHDTQASVAIHEASHLVMNEQIRVPGTNLAAAVAEGGRSGLSTHGGGAARPAMLAAAPDWMLVTSAWYAGRLGELMACGARWTRPIVDEEQTDFRRSLAVLMLQPVDHARVLPSMMARSQQFALRVLHARWGRVLEVAQQLMTHGSYACCIDAKEQINPSALPGSGAGGAAGD